MVKVVAVDRAAVRRAAEEMLADDSRVKIGLTGGQKRALELVRQQGRGQRRDRRAT